MLDAYSQLLLTLQPGTFLVYFLPDSPSTEGKCVWIIGLRVCCPPPFAKVIGGTPAPSPALFIRI